MGERRNWFAEERERFTVAFGGRLVVLLASYGGVGGGEAGGGWNGRKKEGEKNCRNRGRGAGFWPTLDSIFFLLGP